MKTILKERILNLVSTMESANGYFSGSWEKESAEGLAAACQEAAMQIGGILEEHEPALTALVAALEEYCELIYHLYTEEKAERAALLDRLTDVVAGIRTGIERDVSEEKVKAVFLPYNASMWDSFDSIYRAAKADLRFEVKVVPIPYYSLDPYGRPREEHYEGREVARYAEITDYKTWSPVLERPDVVFIHNPYDECNRVTRISERFFSSELIKYTPHLVYIPYYISKGKTMEGSSYMPGVRNAWRVFVQNETIREQFISEGIAPEKVAALGSPKLDMVFCTENREIPEEWGVLKGKKVFFYNTALTDILNEREAFLKKVRHVLSTFNEKKDVALLWRPHPLSVPTMEAMAPGLLEEYLRIVEDFKRSGLGVFDESSDLNRAVAVSDAYIGNIGSSVSQLYEATGKPVFYVEYSDPEFELERRWAKGLCAEIVDRKLYMFAWEYNRIFIYDLDTKELREELGDPRCAPYEKYLYSMSTKIGSSIYFAPSMTSTILKYDPSDGSRKLIELGTKSGSVRENWGNYIHYRGKIYNLPTWATEYIKVLDLKSEKVTYLPTNYSRVFSGLGETEEIFFSGETRVGNTVWRACFRGPFFQKFHLDSGRLEYIKINGLEEQLWPTVYDGAYFWLLPVHGTNIYQWDPRKNKIRQTLTLKRGHDSRDNMVFHSMVFSGGSIWVFLREEFCAIRVDPATGETEALEFSELFNDCCGNLEPELFSGNIKQFGDWLLLLPVKAKGMVLINTATKEIRRERLLIPHVLLEEKNTKASESMCTLNAFLQGCQQAADVSCKRDAMSAGQQIWEYIVDQLYT